MAATATATATDGSRNSITTGFLYPAYSSYKAIRNNDAQAIEHWLMYAVVLSVVHAAESTVEWTVNWWVRPATRVYA